MRLDELLRKDLVRTPRLINEVADAIVVWDRQGHLREFVEKGRKLIQKANLVRYKTPDGEYGWKRKNGKPIEPVEL